MTKKDYELIADILRYSPHLRSDNEAENEHLYDAYANTCKYFASRLAQLDERFKRAEFLKACGVQD